jgi:pimeloyl-ACP methyl ester carboxylesterase
MKLLKSAIWFSPGHTLRDIRVFISGMNFSVTKLFPEVPGYDAWQQGTRFEIPFFIFQGENDVLTLPSQAEAYFDDVIAPVKGMTLIRDAGHFAAFTQPEQFLRELLTRVRPLAIETRATQLMREQICGSSYSLSIEDAHLRRPPARSV